MILPHLAGRPLTIKRYPNGVDAAFFYEKNAARGTPDWIRTVSLPVPGSTKDRERIDYIIVEELADPGLGRQPGRPRTARAPVAGDRRRDEPQTDLIVFDLDPGPPADDRRMPRGRPGPARRARRRRPQPAAQDVRVEGHAGQRAGRRRSTPAQTSDYAHDVAQRLEKALPNLAISRMSKSLRTGKVFVDWSQNNPAKTTVAPYSLRARPQPTASTPLTWDEVEAGGVAGVHRAGRAGAGRRRR